MRVGLPKTVWRLATDCTVRGSNSDIVEVYLMHPDRFWGPPASYTIGTEAFSGVKWPGRGVDHPPKYSVEVKGRSYTFPPPLRCCGLF